MKYPKAGDLQRATGVQITSNPSPKYSERRGWTGGDSRTLYAIEDQRTGRVVVRPGGELAGIGSEAVVRIATRAEAEEHWQGQLHAGWHVAESNPHAPKQNPWEVHSDSGLEGVFFDEDSARFFAEEIRGGGARGIRVERRVKRPPHRNPPSGRWAGASLTLTNIAQNMEVLGVSGCNSLLKYVPVEVAGVGYGWLFKCLPDGHDVVVEMDGGGMQTFAASQVTPVAGRVPESPTQLALRAKYKAEDEEERRERGNPAPGLGHKYVLGSNPIKMHRNPTFHGRNNPSSGHLMPVGASLRDELIEEIDSTDWDNVDSDGVPFADRAAKVRSLLLGATRQGKGFVIDTRSLTSKDYEFLSDNLEDGVARNMKNIAGSRGVGLGQIGRQIREFRESIGRFGGVLPEENPASDFGGPHPDWAESNENAVRDALARSSTEFAEVLGRFPQSVLSSDRAKYRKGDHKREFFELPDWKRVYVFTEYGLGDPVSDIDVHRAFGKAVEYLKRVTGEEWMWDSINPGKQMFVMLDEAAARGRKNPSSGYLMPVGASLRDELLRGLKAGDRVAFNFTLYGGEARSGTGVIVSSEPDYSVWPPGVTVRVESSEHYGSGEIVSVATHDVLKVNR